MTRIPKTLPAQYKQDLKQLGYIYEWDNDPTTVWYKCIYDFCSLDQGKDFIFDTLVAESKYFSFFFFYKPHAKYFVLTLMDKQQIKEENPTTVSGHHNSYAAL